MLYANPIAAVIAPIAIDDMTMSSFVLLGFSAILPPPDITLASCKVVVAICLCLANGDSVDEEGKEEEYGFITLRWDGVSKEETLWLPRLTNMKVRT